jgi:hypothetical protein
MTQIITYINKDAVYLASDRRLTIAGALSDDHVNKAVIFDGRVCFSFTGLAHLSRGEPTSDWLTRALSEAKTSDLAAVLTHLQEQAASAMRSLKGVRAVDRRLTFVAAGWSRAQAGTAGVYGRVTNDLGHGLSPTFSCEVTHVGPASKRSTIVAVEGQPLPIWHRRHLVDVVRHYQRRKGPHAPVTKALVRAVRATADANVTVGRRVLTTVIPRSVVGVDGRRFTVLAAPTGPESSVCTCQYWEDGTWNGVTYGPNVASSSGAYATGFRGGSLPPQLGGMRPNGPSGFTVTYPVAALQLPDDGFAMVKQGTNLGMVLVTDRNLCGRLLDGRFRGARPVVLSSRAEISNCAGQMQNQVTHILFDPDPETLMPAEWISISDL